MPVMVILCGSKNGYSDPDYLEFRYKIGGSIYTIEEDIIILARRQDEDTITIGGTLYKLISGRFSPITKKVTQFLNN